MGLLLVFVVVEHTSHGSSCDSGSSYFLGERRGGMKAVFAFTFYGHDGYTNFRSIESAIEHPIIQVYNCAANPLPRKRELKEERMFHLKVDCEW